MTIHNQFFPNEALAAVKPATPLSSWIRSIGQRLVAWTEACADNWAAAAKYEELSALPGAALARRRLSCATPEPDVRAAATGAPVAMEIRRPSMSSDEAYKEWWATYLTCAASPGAAKSVLRMNMEIDVGRVLPAIRAPTLSLHRTGNRLTTADDARHLGKDIRGVRSVELAGANHAPWAGDTDALADEIEEFLTGIRQAPEPDRILATVLFTDIVGSTKQAVELGDRNWGELLHQHDGIVRRQLARFHGREVRNNGDGFLATFDGPGRGIRCAVAIRRQVRALGIEVRAGLHTGECQIEGSELSGVAVHIGNRVATSAKPGEVLVSSTVKDLVFGSFGIAFEDRGMHALKGLPGEWHLFAAASADEVID